MTVTTEEPNALQTQITSAMIDEYLKTFGIGAKLTPNERQMFLRTAQTWGLNPIKREIHVSAFGSGEYRQCSIIVGYEVYIKRADRTGKLDGYYVEYEGSGNNLKAIITIWRKDWHHPFKHEVFFDEAAQRKKDGELNAVWKKMPRFMLRKVAISQGFRLCFPDDLGGMPYAEGELPGEIPTDEERNVTPAAPEDEERAVLLKELGTLLRTEYNGKRVLDKPTIDSVVAESKSASCTKLRELITTAYNAAQVGLFAADNTEPSDASIPVFSEEVPF